MRFPFNKVVLLTFLIIPGISGTVLAAPIGCNNWSFQTNVSSQDPNNTLPEYSCGIDSNSFTHKLYGSCTGVRSGREFLVTDDGPVALAVSRKIEMTNQSDALATAEIYYNTTITVTDKGLHPLYSPSNPDSCDLPVTILYHQCFPYSGNEQEQCHTDGQEHVLVFPLGTESLRGHNIEVLIKSYGAGACFETSEAPFTVEIAGVEIVEVPPTATPTPTPSPSPAPTAPPTPPPTASPSPSPTPITSPAHHGSKEVQRIYRDF